MRRGGGSRRPEPGGTTQPAGATGRVGYAYPRRGAADPSIIDSGINSCRPTDTAAPTATPSRWCSGWPTTRSRRARSGGEPVERVFYPVAVDFKGSGFYATDYGARPRRGWWTPLRRRARRTVPRIPPQGRAATSKADSSSGSLSSRAPPIPARPALLERLRSSAKSTNPGPRHGDRGAGDRRRRRTGRDLRAIRAGLADRRAGRR